MIVSGLKHFNTAVSRYVLKLTCIICAYKIFNTNRMVDDTLECIYQNNGTDIERYMFWVKNL